jgi:hypothetical protein
MASTDVPRLNHVSESDIAGCMALSSEAGWNQMPDDWALFMRHGTVFGLAGTNGKPVATGAILPYSGGFAWISMVLVTASRRRARIGTSILETCCSELERRASVAVLDATPAGERVYRPLGFEPISALSRWQGEGGPGGNEPPMTTRRMNESDLGVIAEIDAAAFGAHRAFLLESFFQRAPQLAFTTQKLDGFVLARPGRIATQIGPLIAANRADALALLRAALGAARGPVFLDVADRWEAVAEFLRQRAFTVQRPYLRMVLRRRDPFGDPTCTFIVAGPEFG